MRTNERSSWDHNEWEKVFIDKSKFTSQPDNRHILYFDLAWARYNSPQAAQEKLQYEASGVMIWARISTRGHTDL
ncbi:hypothetical protein Trydic_g14509 [Trypoxylus dichotomus]